MKIRICYHGNCFDGVSSAAVFGRFYRERVHPDWEQAFQPMMHRAGALFDDKDFDGDENAVVDFKYSPSPRLTWWFDHHKSAFLTPEDEAHFRADTSGKKFVDATFKSCTGFIAAVARDKFGFDTAPMSELIRWADKIDGAFYESAAEAVEMKSPALRLALVIENERHLPLVERIIRDLQRKPLGEVAAADYVQERIEPLYQRHLRALEIIRQAARMRGPVVFFDVAGHDMEGYSKFIPYYLHPASVYSVSVSQSTFRSKISVGSNPWAPRPRTHDLAKICERYGGGGHAVVAAISLAPEKLDEARRIAEEIVEELQQ
ncbi:MAG TPA: DHH family phosphoesterase [Blastocatellia bacterium]|nr:DHH family phosphoesterase [Blastocatellia bacterium]